ncbi:MAG TPA: iron-sulfur cluster assembly accessory protein [Gammaproteobacteria bacterium]|nr:iron-sulfur cluster assembly accessory protein [Gammaproteobacteria bacterium]
MLRITEAAANQIKSQTQQSGSQEMVLRIAAKTNQDGSFEYGMGFDESKEADITITQHGVDIIVDPQSAELLEETEMDYAELEKDQFSFIFSNPLDPNYKAPAKGR